MTRWLTRSRRRRLRGSARRVGFALAPLVALALLAECTARALWDPLDAMEMPDVSEGTVMAPHPTRIWGLRPGSELEQFGALTPIDDDGLRSAPDTGAPLRVLTLGDSSIFGHALAHDDTLHAKIGAALAARGVRADVFCGGIPGYTTEQTLRLLDEVGWALQPDLLVVGNLWSDNSYDTFVDRVWLDTLDHRGARFEGTLRFSRAYAWARHTLNPPPPPPEAGSEHVRVSWVRDPYETGRRRVPVNEYVENLEAILDAARARGVGALILAPANIHRLEGAAFPGGRKAGWDIYFQANAAVAERRGAPRIDAVEVLHAAGLTEREAFVDSMHPTGRGNGLYAEAIAEALSAAGWPAERLLPAAAEGPPPTFVDFGDVEVEMAQPDAPGEFVEMPVGEDEMAGVPRETPR